MSVIVVIPAFNEAATLPEVVRGALEHASAVVIVDDGSTDGMAGLAASSTVDVIVHSRNLGKSKSLVDGFARALELGATQVLTMDGDGQHRAADIPRLLRAAECFAQAVIIGARVRRAEDAPRARRMANRFADFAVSWAVGRRVLDSQSGQRVYPAALLRALDLHRLSQGSFTLESEIIIKAAQLGFATVSVPIDAIYDPMARRSHFRAARHIPGIVAMITRDLLRKGLNLHGLWTSLRGCATTFDDGGDATAPVAEPAALQRVHQQPSRG